MRSIRVPIWLFVVMFVLVIGTLIYGLNTGESEKSVDSTSIFQMEDDQKALNVALDFYKNGYVEQDKIAALKLVDNRYKEFIGIGIDSEKGEIPKKEQKDALVLLFESHKYIREYYIYRSDIDRTFHVQVEKQNQESTWMVTIGNIVFRNSDELTYDEINDKYPDLRDKWKEVVLP